MARKGESFSIIRLNDSDHGWGVIDDASGALTHINGLAIRLTKERAKEVAAQLNAEASEFGTAAVKLDSLIDLERDPGNAPDQS